ncbi:hypothetical protein MNBD_ALPHA08-922 [hydrothermal vent metagenome]|uniref:Thioredoxin domain-containing protein n=1 Tax=hydrothermal vent metagenome TaxID=652676 RepID=A0A3B0RSS9_9ZZZZ
MNSYRFDYGFFRRLFVLAAILAFVMPATNANAQLLHDVKAKPAAKNFELPDLDGKNVKLSDFSGKVVVVNFWATWCPPCRKEIPSMQRAWNILKEKDVMMLAVHVGGTEDKVWTFLTDFGVEFPVLMDKSSKVSRAWPLVGLPVTFIVDPKGRIALRAIGGREWDDPKLIDQILALRE